VEQVQRKNKILLIEPPFYRLYKDSYSLCKYPLSLGYLAGTIKKETNWDVMVYNTDFSPKNGMVDLAYLTGIGFKNYLNNLNNLSSSLWKKIKSTIEEYKPTVIGISSKSQNFRSSCIIAKFAKEIDSKIIVVVGGPHPSMIGVDILKDRNIDVSVKGEGEITIIELLNAIDKQETFNNVNGIIYRNDSQIVENPSREYIKDLDSLCFPHQYASEVLKDYDQYPKQAFQSIFATRGCPYSCFFCGSRNIWSKKTRFRSAMNVINEIKSLQQMEINFIHFDDDTFGINKEYINQLCNSIIQNCPGLKWSCEIHVNLVDEQSIALMKKAGCTLIQVGIESGNNEMLKRIRKGITIEKAISATNIISRCGIALSAFFMIGFPEETEETLNDTMKTMEKINGTIYYSIFTPYPGTEAFQFCKEKGLIDTNYDVSLYNHQSPENCFCMNLTKEQFRTRASEIEIFVDRHNKNQQLKQILSMNKVIGYIKEYGIIYCLKMYMLNFIPKR
jgi:radical SAM superfamily enzyme YgiQ (UPF0313 family)